MALDDKVLATLEALARQGLNELAFDYVNKLRADNGFQRQAYIKHYLSLTEKYAKPREYPVKWWRGC